MTQDKKTKTLYVIILSIVAIVGFLCGIAVGLNSLK